MSQSPGDRDDADQQPADQQPADQQPADQQPADQQPADQQPADQRPATEQRPTGGARRDVLLLPLRQPRQGAELAAYLGVPADALPAGPGVLVAPRSGEVDQDLAVRASRLLRRSEVVVLRLADERVAVERWRGGRLVDQPPYGTLGDLGEDAERVVVGALPASQASGAVGTDGVDRRAFARAALTAARGPVKTWQVALQAGLALFASFLALVYLLQLVTGNVQTGGDWFRVILWPLLAAFWVVALRGLLRRRAVERQEAAQRSGGSTATGPSDGTSDGGAGGGR